MKELEFGFYYDFLKELNHNNTEYIIIGGWSVIYHGYEYHTGDLDIWYNPTEENIDKIYCTIKKFGYDVSGLKKKDLLKININPTSVWNRKGFEKIDFMSSAGGDLTYENAQSRCKTFKIGNLKINILSYDDLYKTKKRSKRKKDQIHLYYLEKVRKYIKKMGRNK